MGVVLTEDIEFTWHRSKELSKSATVFIDRPAVAAREVTRTIIVCGDCAGDSINPHKTLLTREGRCADCGGRSYILASKLFKRRLL